ncbi:MAG: Asp-tRNA(Asn)/Glu-tRNA(Gln) amidotransferase subunit GatB [Verrucomicrobia bacterium]|nr:MAG: Asp-tRNA(Asn)/Glu-tRNA(Gln) amidotransferase subunit GatB [Verrucomicrobiota bacterium]
MSGEYEAVIGLEVHVQIRTRSKMFTRVPTGFGEPPNTLVDPVVLGLPGALPVMNKAALDAIILTGLMFECDIAPVCKWDRKNYFYPDSPKNYQISQYDMPICANGRVEIELPGPSRNVMGPHRHVRLTRIHLEEDVGKLNHFANDSLVDLNRAGTPLVEIVTEPDMHTADEVFAFLTALRQAMVAAGISDCDMEKGQMRCDANISVRPVGQQTLGTKVELKNLNSISGVRNGVDYEIRRQIAALQRGETIVQETRRFDMEALISTPMRTKEEAHDYRYFPDPDLMPVRVDQAWLDRLRARVPELAFDKQRRFFEQYKLPYTITSVLVPDRALSDWFEAAVDGHVERAQAIANWIVNDLLRELAATGQTLADCRIQPSHIAGLVEAQESGVISSKIAREVFAEMFQTGESAAEVIERKGLRQTSDTAELEKWCAEAIAGKPQSVADFKAGNEKAINAFKGPVMKASRGKANPKLVDEILRRMLAEM